MRLWVFICLALALMLGFAPLAAQDNEASTLNIVLPPAQSFDPVSLSRFDESGRDVVENLFIGLTRINARTGQVEPWLATEWTVSDDGLLWTFSLRDDVQWVQSVDGNYEALRPVTADDVVFAVRRACDPASPSPVAQSIYILENCRVLATHNSLQPYDISQVGVVAVDDTTVQFRLLFPSGAFLTLTALPEFRPLPEEVVNFAPDQWLNPLSTVTSGMWVVEDWNEGTMNLVRNPFWEGDYAGNIQRVNIAFGFPTPTIPAPPERGAYDVARLDLNQFDISATDQPDLLQASIGDSLQLLGFSFNNLNPDGLLVPSPFDSPEVRRAFALALDRDALAAAVYGAGAFGSDHFTPRSAMGAPSSPAASFDARGAVQTLNRAGYATCADLGTGLLFAVQNDPQDITLANAMIAQWSQTLGCTAETFAVTPVPRSLILDTARNTVDVLETSRYPLWLISWTADYPDAQSWVSDALHCRYGYFQTGRTCNTIDTLMDQGGVAVEIAERFPVYNQIENELFGTLGSFPVIPLVMQQQWWVQKPWVSGVPRYGVFQFDRWNLEFE